jgi:hypothetical protein
VAGKDGASRAARPLTAISQTVRTALDTAAPAGHVGAFTAAGTCQGRLWLSGYTASITRRRAELARLLWDLSKTALSVRMSHSSVAKPPSYENLNERGMLTGLTGREEPRPPRPTRRAGHRGAAGYSDRSRRTRGI